MKCDIYRFAAAAIGHYERTWRKEIFLAELTLLELIDIAAGRSHVPRRDSQLGTATQSAAVVHVSRTQLLGMNSAGLAILE